MAHYQYYVDLEQMQAMREHYEDTIADMKEMYGSLENCIQELIESQAWQGESYQVFIEKYMKWKKAYLTTINQVISLHLFIDDLIYYTNEFIDERKKIG